MNRTLILAKFHFKATAMTKTFLVVTLIGPLLIIGLAVVPSLLTEKMFTMDSGAVIGLIGGEDSFRDEIIAASSGALTLHSYDDETAVRSALDNEDIGGYLHIPSNDSPYRYYSPSGTDIVAFETIKGIVGQLVVTKRMAAKGWDPVEVNEMTRPPRFEALKMEEDLEDASEQDFGSLIYTAIGFIMLLYMTVLLYGQMIGRSVVTEKSSKTVELMLSSVKPWELMFGKILGIGLAGIIQYLFWIGVSAILILVVGPQFELSLPSALNLGNLFYLLLFFILAFFIYASLYAALGAASEDEQNMGQLAWPLLIFLIVPMVMIAALVASPDGALTKGLSLFPLTAPLVMFVRILVKFPPLWELLLSIGLMVLTIIGVIWGGGKIFRFGILMTGKKGSLKDVMSLLRRSN